MVDRIPTVLVVHNIPHFRQTRDSDHIGPTVADLGRTDLDFVAEDIRQVVDREQENRRREMVETDSPEMGTVAAGDIHPAEDIVVEEGDSPVAEGIRLRQNSLEVVDYMDRGSRMEERKDWGLEGIPEEDNLE